MTPVRTFVTGYFRDARGTATQVLALLMAVWFTSNGPVALAMNPDFSMHPMHSHTVHVLGFIPVTVNGWHALFHFVTGVAGLLCVRTKTAAVWYAAVTALIYLVVGALGLAGGTSVCGMMAVDTFGNWVHVVEGVILVAIAAYGVVGEPDSIRPSALSGGTEVAS
ncbi:DUF4383 domain-containing protein [Nocardia sp. NPDC050175]|uniref:DUF4383 domain-containing protein n=1 Tax=Nocardia sp. NPDC050175 TaxID=3364317 RepID=UPI0037B25282